MLKLYLANASVKWGETTCTESLDTAICTLNFVLSRQVMSSMNIPQWMRSYCFSSSQFDSSTFCQKTGDDFCRTGSLAAGRAHLVLLQHPEAEKKKASTLASICSAWEELKPFNSWLESCPVNICPQLGRERRTLHFPVQSPTVWSDLLLTDNLTFHNCYYLFAMLAFAKLVLNNMILFLFCFFRLLGKLVWAWTNLFWGQRLLAWV